MHRILAAGFLAFALTASTAFADDEPHAAVVTPTIAAAAASLAQNLVHTPDFRTPDFTPWRTPSPSRPPMLPALYASAAFLHGYDVYSTLAAKRQGGREANPLLSRVTDSPAVFIGLKVGVAAASIVLSERMWRQGQRMRAIAMMAAANGVMAYVATHNARVLEQLKTR